jgi:hypothetical protein
MAREHPIPQKNPMQSPINAAGPNSIIALASFQQV